MRREEQGEGKAVMNMNEENRKSRYKGRVKGGINREKRRSVGGERGEGRRERT